MSLNSYLSDIPKKCSIKHQHLAITIIIWTNLMKQLLNDDFETAEVDLLTKDNKSTHSIVRTMLYEKAKEQFEAGHGFEFGFISKPNHETLVCFKANCYHGLPKNIQIVR